MPVGDKAGKAAGRRGQLQHRAQMVLWTGTDGRGAGRDGDQPEPAALPEQQHCRAGLQRDPAAMRGERAGARSDFVRGFDAHRSHGKQAQGEAGGGCKVSKAYLAELDVRDRDREALEKKPSGREDDGHKGTVERSFAKAKENHLRMHAYLEARTCGNNASWPLPRTSRGWLSPGLSSFYASSLYL